MKHTPELPVHVAANRPQPLIRIAFLCLLLGSAICADAQWLPNPWTSGPISFPGTNVGINTTDTTLANECDAGLVIRGATPALRLIGDPGDGEISLGRSRVGAFATPPVPIGSGACSDYQLSTGGPSGGFMIFDVCAALPRLSIDPDGDVIAGTVMADNVQVNGGGMMTVSGAGLQTNGGPLTFGSVIGWRTSVMVEHTWMTISSAGKVAVGVDAPPPVHFLDVTGAPVVNGGANEVLGVYDTRAVAAGVGGGIVFGGKTSTTSSAVASFGSIQGVKENATSGDNASALLFFTHANAAAPAERMRIGSDGLLTVGATGGTGTKLAVNGSVRSFSGGFQFPDGTIQASAAINSQWSQSGSSLYYTAGNVGIGAGMTSPSSPLSVNGVIYSAAGGFKFPDGTTQTTASTAQASGWNPGQVAGSVYHSGGSVGIGTDHPDAPLQVITAGGVGALVTAPGDSFMRVNSTAALHPYADFILSNSAGPAYGEIRIGDDATWRNLVLLKNGGAVAIGTAAPAAMLHVNGGATTNGAARRSIVAFDSSPSAAGVGGGISFGGNYSATSSTPDFANIWGIKEVATDNDKSGALLFGTTSNAGTPAERMRIGSNGMVSIAAGTGTRLTVNGDTKITGNIDLDGNINAKYQDVAEWVPATELLPGGTVVVLDPNVSNQVMPSSEPYATTVAGVVSDRPGIILGVRGDMKLKVATTGRVKVKVDATKGAVRIGDLLVTGDEPGTAMKSQPIDVGGMKIHRPGTLIGKALEPLSGGHGEILVLLSLQ